MRTYERALPALLGLALLACPTAGQDPPTSQPSRDHGDAPMDVGGKIDSIWAYLQPRYDANDDGTITPAEYKRAGQAFERLDSNGDGVLTVDDFAARRGRGGRGARGGRGGGRGNRAAMMRGMTAERMIARYFQDDDTHAEITTAELKRCFAAYDTNGDDKIDQAEFDAIAEERRVSPPGEAMMARFIGDAKPWPTILAAGDGDRDDAMSRDEIVDFFATRADGDVLVIRAMRGGDVRGGRGGRGGAGGGRAKTGPAEGTVAPDFTLTPSKGGFPITLSDFKGEKPVALIFGSYT